MVEINLKLSRCRQCKYLEISDEDFLSCKLDKKETDMNCTCDKFDVSEDVFEELKEALGLNSREIFIKETK